jgi:hypothetical protein
MNHVIEFGNDLAAMRCKADRATGCMIAGSNSPGHIDGLQSVRYQLDKNMSS